MRAASPLSEARLLCLLYAKLGTQLVAKLRGQFAFLVYNSLQVRGACTAALQRAVDRVL